MSSVQKLILDFAKLEKGSIAGYIILLLIGTTVSLVGITKVTASIYSNVSAGSFDNTVYLLFALAILTVAFTICNWGIDYIENKLMPTFHRYVRTKVTQSIIDANETSMMTNTNALKFRAYVSASTQSSTTIFNAIIKQYIPNTIMALILIGFLFYLSPAYGGVFLGAIVIIIILLVANQKNMRDNAKAVELRVRYADTFAFDVLKNLESVVSNGQIKAEKEAIANKIAAAACAQIEQSQKFDNVAYILNGILSAAVFVTMALAIYKLKGVDASGSASSDTTIHAVLTALSLMAKLQAKMSSLNGTNLTTIQSLGRYDANHLASVADYKAPPNGFLPVCASGDWCDVQIQFKNVSFKYPQSSKYVIKNFNWSIGPRGVYCLRAPSGSGKSTLAQLILRLYDVTSGSIEINGLNSKKINLNDLRSQIKLLNDKTLFERSIRENLCYGSPDQCSNAKIEQIWNEMKDMFDGFSLNDSVGPDGSYLSTGMKAMLRFNQALLSDSSVVICDEPTNGLSPEYKARVLETIQHIGINKTVLMITHDAETATIARETKDVTTLA